MNTSRRHNLKIIGTGMLGVVSVGCNLPDVKSFALEKTPHGEREELYVSRVFTPRGGFTTGVEGPACDRYGNLFAVNFQRQGTIGRVTPGGSVSLFIELPEGSIGNGIRFNSDGDMFVADYNGHHIYKVDMKTLEIGVFINEQSMNQPNDLAVSSKNILYVSDPDWKNNTGNLWRVDPDAALTLLESGMGTTNGIDMSPDEKTLYVNESIQRNVWAYDVTSDGSLHNKRLLIRFPEHRMDGMRCDSGGNLYITRSMINTVVKVSPRGKILLEVKTTGNDPSNVTFGGPDGRTCYVTVHDQGNIEYFRTELPGRDWLLFKKWAEAKKD